MSSHNPVLGTPPAPQIGREAAKDMAHANASLTDVELASIEGRLAHWIRFGRVAAERIIDCRSRMLSFRPGMTFALIRWSSSDFGTCHASMRILVASAAGETMSASSVERSRAKILLRADNRAAVDHVLGAVDSIEAAGIDPCEVSPDHWRHLSDQVAAGTSSRPYTAERHAAWLRRKAFES